MTHFENRPWLSVLIPIYNVAEFLEDCIDSVARQWIEGVEVLVLDDASTDNSEEIILQLTGRYSFLKSYRHELNRGVSAARNSLLKYASGEYIWFLDSDDFILPNALHEIQSQLKSKEPDILMFDYIMVSEDIAALTATESSGHHIATLDVTGKQALLANKARILMGMLRKRRFQTWARISRYELWNSGLTFPEGKYFEDLFCVPELVFSAERFAYCRLALIAYRERSSSIVQSPDVKKVADLLAAACSVLDLWSRSNYPLNRKIQLVHIRFCAITFINGMKMLKKSGLNTEDNRQMLRDFWFKSLDLNIFQLIICFMSNGRFGTLIRFLRHMYGPIRLRVK
ncbi:glycosyltransferase family 2 protein [Teredinibacter haidensis]|uniref:glycosyltransferase family 2 protein n=1 Tax=Teredinibacter haidensis TaxID=2731755 RepID=UPI0009489CEA|nr:glycosyltransferase family 2 protein [Teredinibacter haidensis]